MINKEVREEKQFREKEETSNFGHTELQISDGSPEAAGYSNPKLRNEAWTGDTLWAWRRQPQPWVCVASPKEMTYQRDGEELGLTPSLGTLNSQPTLRSSPALSW